MFPFNAKYSFLRSLHVLPLDPRELLVPLLRPPGTTLDTRNEHTSVPRSVMTDTAS